MFTAYLTVSPITTPPGEWCGSKSATILSDANDIFGHPLLAEQLTSRRYAARQKPYQIRQFLRLVERYGLTMEEEG